VSLILDALRRKTADRGEDNADEPARTTRAAAVLATLGYARPAVRTGPSFKAFLAYAVSAIVIGFVGLWLLIVLLAPSSPRNSQTALRGASAPSARPSTTSAPQRPPVSGPQSPQPDRPSTSPQIAPRLASAAPPPAPASQAAPPASSLQAAAQPASAIQPIAPTMAPRATPSQTKPYAPSLSQPQEPI